MSKQSVRETPARNNFDLELKGLGYNHVHPNTAATSARLIFRGTVTQPLVPPIYHSSTYVMEKLEDCFSGLQNGGSIYSRNSNLSTESTEAAISAIERGAGSLTFSSGMAAVTSCFLGFLKSGDHVIYQLPCYPSTITALKLLRDEFGVEITPVREVTVEVVESLVKHNTKMIWIETPCNPEIVVVDIAKFGALARSRDILLGVDGTFASPVLQHVIPYGVDFSVHSCTKYMGGHADLIGGCVTTRTIEQWRILKKIQWTFGNMLSPHDASLLLRGLKTLPLRMDRISRSAGQVAAFLEQHPKVERVLYPGLKSHPQHEVARKQMTAFSGMIMAEIKGGEQGARAVAENIRLVRLAVSLGGTDSILEHPYSMTHGPYLLKPEEIAESGILPGMLRISIGLEEPEDIINDFEQALTKVQL